MPRRPRCIVAGAAHHVTQRGVDRGRVFETDADRAAYLRAMQQNLSDAEVRLLAWCLMTNHVHLVAVPAREDSLSVLLRRAHGKYAQYYNVRQGRTGHLWQNRYFACTLEGARLPQVLAYVERNPVVAGLATGAAEYRWSSAVAHLKGEDHTGLLDMGWWEGSGLGEVWTEILCREDEESRRELRRCTYAGRPYGSAEFVEELGRRFGRTWQRGRPRRARAVEQGWAAAAAGQLELFKDEGWKNGADQAVPITA